jgi:hypothetical protein
VGFAFSLFCNTKLNIPGARRGRVRALHFELADALWPLPAISAHIRSCCRVLPPMQGYDHPATKWTNTAYGDRAVIGDNIVLVNGNMDPWHALGEPWSIAGPSEGSAVAVYCAVSQGSAYA